MVQWYPGHMAKALREMEEKVKIVDLVMVLLDSRIPLSSLNPKLKSMFNNKKILYIFTKADKADKSLTEKWINYYSVNGNKAIAVDARDKKTVKIVEREALELLKEKRAKDAAKGLKPRPIRTMIVGIPNVGKSTLINTLCGKKVAVVGDKPGVTKSQQWTRINQTIKADILRNDDICIYFLGFLKTYYPEAIKNRYNVEILDDLNETLIKIGESLHFYLGNKDVDIDKTALYILQEYRNDYLGKMTLDRL